MKNARLSGFYRLSRPERLTCLARNGWICESDLQALASESATLTPPQANRMVENVVGVFGLPFAVAPNFLINGKQYVVPLVVEEPSIVAALSFAAKLAADSGGIQVETTEPILTGQVQLVGMENADEAAANVLHYRRELLALGNSLQPRMVARGGGLRDLEVTIHRPRHFLRPTCASAGSTAGQQDMVVVHLHVDTRDAMGANAVNSLCEAMAPTLEALTGGKACLRILSNLTDQARVLAKVAFEPAVLATDSHSGEAVREGIITASTLAEIDPYRAATHNKGIMNGVDAVAVATGNDWRAIEAAAHAYAARGGRYTSLSRWYAGPDGRLVGELEMPLKVGIIGGNLESNPMVGVAHRLLDVGSARELAGVMGAVGLAQNFSALRALATDGIQRGHMALHARSVAASAGIPDQDFEAVVASLIASRDIKVWKAKDILAKREGARHGSEGPRHRSAEHPVLSPPDVSARALPLGY